MPHFMEFAAWLWSIGEKPENYHLYVKPWEHCHVCDLRAEFTRWDRMFERHNRHWKRWHQDFRRCKGLSPLPVPAVRNWKNAKQFVMNAGGS